MHRVKPHQVLFGMASWSRRSHRERRRPGTYPWGDTSRKQDQLNQLLKKKKKKKKIAIQDKRHHCNLRFFM